jgi:hypothetical protein
MRAAGAAEGVKPFSRFEAGALTRDMIDRVPDREIPTLLMKVGAQLHNLFLP